MEKKSILFFFEKINVKLFFFLLFIYQFIFSLQGLDLSDEGFFATFYQQIYKHPETVQYNFVFWFSGMLGGLIDYVFPGSGLLGFRLAGVLINMFTIIITYNLLKKYLQSGHLKVALFLLTIFISHNAKEIQYNNLSVLFYIITAYFLFTGLSRNKFLRLFIAGLIISLNTFTRLPNVLGLGLVAAIIYQGYIKNIPFRVQLKQSLTLISGFLAMTGVILVVMKLIGHLNIYANSLEFIVNMSRENPASRGKGVSSYQLGTLIKNFFKDYLRTIVLTAFVIGSLLIAVLISEYLKKKSSYNKWFIFLGSYILLGFFCIWAIKGNLDNNKMLFFFTGICIISFFLIFIGKNNHELKILMFIGVFILIVFPLGSSEGIRMVGPYSLWLAFPITIDFLFNIKTINSNLFFSAKEGGYSAKIFISELQLNALKKFILLACIIVSLYYSYNYPFFDRVNRIKMFYSVHNKYLKGIYTSKARATAIDELLEQTAKYVRPDEYLMAYDCIPMINYLTETKPFIRSSYPWLYVPDVFKKELSLAVEKNEKLPVIVSQTIKTIGNASDWPQYPIKIDSEWEDVNRARNNYFHEFLATYKYKEVWTNGIFKIWLPPAQSLQ